MNTPIENIPMNVTIYNQQIIDNLLATDTSQLLAFEASAVVRTENDGFLSRGFSSVGVGDGDVPGALTAGSGAGQLVCVGDVAGRQTFCVHARRPFSVE